MTLPEPNWSGSEEDHSFRSHVIQWLLHRDPKELSREEDCGTTIPRVVIQYWHDRDELPNDVAECINSWRQLEREGFNVHLFDDVLARQFISASYGTRYLTAFDRCYHPAMRCDYFRLCYILQCGGFYVDADEV